MAKAPGSVAGEPIAHRVEDLQQAVNLWKVVHAPVLDITKNQLYRKRRVQVEADITQATLEQEVC